MTNNIDEEAPLDPILENVRKKLMRVMVISIGVLLIGLLALLFAVIYKISKPDESQTAGTEANSVPPANVFTGALQENVNLDLPDGANVLSSSMQAGRLLLDLQMISGARQLWIVNLETGKVESRVVLK